MPCPTIIELSLYECGSFSFHLACPLHCPPKKNKALKTQRFQGFLAGDERIELPPKVLETPIIPFDQSPILLKCPKLGHLTGR